MFLFNFPEKEERRRRIRSVFPRRESEKEREKGQEVVCERLATLLCFRTAERGEEGEDDHPSPVQPRFLFFSFLPNTSDLLLLLLQFVFLLSALILPKAIERGW